MDHRKVIGEAVMKMRKRAGLTQAALAEQSGTGQSNIADIENGNANPTIDTLNKISDICNCDLEIVIKERKK